MTSSEGPGSFFNLSDINVVESDLFLPVETSHSAWLVFASVFALISLADLLLSILRQSSRTEDDFERLTAIEIATLPLHDGRSKIMDTDSFDAWYPTASYYPTMAIRRRLRLGQGDRQEVQREIATLPLHDGRSKIMDTDYFDAWHLGARFDPSMNIRRRPPLFDPSPDILGRPREPSPNIRRRPRVGQGDRQVLRREISIKDQPLEGEDIPYSIARYLNQPEGFKPFRKDT